MIDFEGFPDPIESYTMVPNEFFELLPYLKGSEIAVSLHIIRKTMGWQKRFDCIALSQFTSELAMHKKTVIDALASLEKRWNCILRYQEGKGSQCRSYYFLKTDLNKEIVDGLAKGHLTIEQAEKINHLNQHNGVKIPTVDKLKIKPNKGANSSPKVDNLGSNSEPTKRKTRALKESLKEIPSLLKNQKSVLVEVLRKHLSQASTKLGRWGELAQKLRRQ